MKNRTRRWKTHSSRRKTRNIGPKKIIMTEEKKWQKRRNSGRKTRNMTRKTRNDRREGRHKILAEQTSQRGMEDTKLLMKVSK